VTTETVIEYRDVRVDGDDGPIVAGFSAGIPAGRLTVMVGPSGAGKTTLLRLLNRLDDPDGGAVYLAGRDVRSYDVLDLRRRVQVVGQVPVTFPGTVADNLLLAAPAADGVRAAAAARGASGFGGPVSFGDVALALVLVAVALGVSRWRRVGLESDMAVATVRSFVQLLAIGYILDFVFRDHGAFTVVVLAVMVGTATLTSGGRAAGVPGARPIAAASIAVG